MREGERDQETPMKPKERKEGKEVVVEVKTLKPLVWREEKDGSRNPKNQTLMVPSPNPRNKKEKKFSLQTLEKGKKEKKTLDLSGIPS